MHCNGKSFMKGSNLVIELHNMSHAEIMTQLFIKRAFDACPLFDQVLNFDRPIEKIQVPRS